MVTMVTPALPTTVGAVVYDPNPRFETKEMISPGVGSVACWQVTDQFVYKELPSA